MRILLFGPHGQVGAEIGALGRDITPVPRSVCDLAAPGAARAAIAAHRCDVVINASGYTAVDKAETEPRLAEAVNAAAPGEMAAACAAKRIPFIHFSTDYVFNGAGKRPYVETDATGPLNVYGATKRDGERRVAQAGGTHAIFRLSWVFSAHGANFVKTMLRLGTERASLRVVADQRGKPTPARAAAEIALAAARILIERPATSGLYHFAGEEETSWADFAEAIFGRAGLKTAVERIATADYPTPAKRPLYSVLDTSKAEAAFGVKAPSWRGALDKIVQDLMAKRG
ncbi:MAG: dTDP-4-dehydrorhamnose reductase [Amphiplicatus sp.]